MRSLFFLMFCIAFISCQKPIEKSVVAIQPYIGISKAETDTVTKVIGKFYNIKTVLLKAKKIYPNAFTNVKSPRYRADSIIKFQRNDNAAFDYVLGLTNKDISITKKDASGNIKSPAYKYADWGIMGLAYCPGNSCIVSNFRLNKKHQQFYTRLKKITVHEFGHNLGLPHCPDKNCVMTDAVESITTVDHAKLALCASCKKKL